MAKATKPKNDDIPEAEDIVIESDQTEAPPKPAPTTDDTITPGRWQRLTGFIKSHRTRSILIVGAILIAPTAVWAYIEYTKPIERVSAQAQIPKRAAKALTKPAPLTGVPVSPANAAKPVVGVVIENHPDARPQSGLSNAGVVYEALAEGGITRFLAFYQTPDLPAKIGPVRSIRTYFVDWALEFSAPIAHAGGNADALDQIQPLGMKDINALNGDPSQYFYRTGDRYAPHNLYTSGDAITNALTKYGFTQAPAFTQNVRKKDEVSASPAHTDINIDYSYNGYQVEYKYNHDCNCYDRFLAGQPHIDATTGKQIQVKNVVVQYMPTSYGKTRINEDTVMMGTPGSGKAIVFRDGGAVEGMWSKSSHTQRTQLLDAASKEIPLDAGNTWYSIVPTTKTVSY